VKSNVQWITRLRSVRPKRGPNTQFDYARRVDHSADQVSQITIERRFCCGNMVNSARADKAWSSPQDRNPVCIFRRAKAVSRRLTPLYAFEKIPCASIGVHLQEETATSRPPCPLLSHYKYISHNRFCAEPPPNRPPKMEVAYQTSRQS
jgi:hypothetical protein